jgi:hypothetical protein
MRHVWCERADDVGRVRPDSGEIDGKTPGF